MAERPLRQRLGLTGTFPTCTLDPMSCALRQLKLQLNFLTATQLDHIDPVEWHR